MKWRKPSVTWSCAAIYVVVISCITILFRRGSHEPVNWLATSRPLITYTHTSTGVIAGVAFNVTNGGPRPVEVFAVWYEARDTAGRRLAWPQRTESPGHFTLPLPQLPRFTLSAGASTNLQWNVGSAGNSNEIVRICASLGWVEAEPPFTIAFRDAALEKVAACVDSIRELDRAPWRWKPRAGKIFLSDGGVAAFFRQFYAWTPETWVGQEAAMRLNERPRAYPTIDTEEETQEWGNANAAQDFAAMEFDSFCRIARNTPQNAEPVAPHEPPPRASVSDAPDDRTLDSLPAPDSGGGR